MKLISKILSGLKTYSKAQLNLSISIFNRLSGQELSLYDKRKFLVIPKNKFILSQREDVTPDLFQDFVNSKDTYDHIWSDSNFVNSYEADKEELYEFVLACVIKYSHASKIEKIVDVGCGTGGLLLKLKGCLPDAEITGIDYSDSSIRRCKERMPQGSFFVSDIHSLSESTQKYDLVLCMEVLEHMQYVDRALNCLRSLLTSSGQLIITIPDGRCDTWTGHINFWDQNEFESVLAVNNFNIISSTRLSDGYNGGYLVFLCTNLS